MVIDSHQHFWKYDPLRHSWISDDMSVIRKDFLPVDLQPLLKENDVDGTVLVQVDQNEDENRFFLSLADQNDFIRGVVGWVDLISPRLDEKLAQLKKFEKLRGFRHIVQGEPDGFLMNIDFINGVRKLKGHGFTYDLLIYHHQLEEAVKFVEQIGEVKVVVDHLAKPSIRTREITEWKKGIKSLSNHPNVYGKLSGMVTEANWRDWKKEDFTPYLDTMFENFGPGRLMYGSDWPVCLVAASYQQQIKIIRDYIKELSRDEQRQIMGLNAVGFYNL